MKSNLEDSGCLALMLAAFLAGLGPAPIAEGQEPAAAAAAGFKAARFAAPPALDGQIEELWTPGRIADFNTPSGAATVPTTAYLGYDDACLYVAFQCHEPQMDKIVAVHTQHGAFDLWKDDHVELFIDVNRDHTNYVQFMVNSLGTTFEQKCQGGGESGPASTDPAWKPKYEVKTARSTNCWTVEMRIPFADLNPGLDTTAEWGMNLCRSRRVPGGLENSAAGRLLLEWKGPVRWHQMLDRLAPASIPFNWTQYARPDFEERRKRMDDEMGKMADDITRLFAGLPQAREVAARVKIARTELAELSRSADDLAGDEARRSAFLRRFRAQQAALAQLRQDLQGLTGAAALQQYRALTGATANGIALWAEPSWATIGPQCLPSGPDNCALNLTGVRNEYVTAQLSLRCDRAGAGSVAFEWTALTNAAGREIGKTNIALFRLTESFAALVPLVTGAGSNLLNVANAVKPEQDKTLAFWVDILIPEDTPAGEFTGEIALTADGKPAARLPVRLRVLELTIPAAPTLPSQCQVFISSAPHLQTNIEAYLEEIWRHRVQPHCDGLLCGPSRVADALNPGGRGWKFIYLYLDGNKQYWPGKWEKFKRGADYYLKLGMSGRLYASGGDAVADDGRDTIAEFSKGLRQAVPELKQMTIAKCRDDEFSKTLQCFVYTSLNSYRAEPDYRAKWEQRRAAGKEAWLMIDAARSSGWTLWREQLNGFYSYGIYADWENPKEEWVDSGWLCPGLFRKKDGAPVGGAPAWTLVNDMKGPVMKRQIKLLRDGLEEYELLQMAARKVGRPQIETLVDAAATNQNAAAWDQARQKVLDILLK